MYKVLYVDDEEPLLEIAKLFLERSGQFSIDTITSAPAALMLMKKTSYDAIIADYQMPEMNGIEFLKKVRASGSRVPFILFTGRGREEVVIESINSGVDFYLQKGGDAKAQFAELSHKLRQGIQKHLAVDALRESEEKYRALVENVIDIVYQTDLNGTVTFVTPSALPLFGYDTLDEVIGRPITSFWADPEKRNVMIAYLKENKFVNDYEVTVVKRDGTHIPVSISSHFYYDKDGQIAGVGGIIRDISERKHSDSALLKSEDQLKRAEEIGRSGSWELQLQGNTINASDGARIIYGFEGKNWTLDEVQKLPLPEYRPLLDTALRDLIAGKSPYNVVFKIQRYSDGAVLDIHSVAKYDPDRNVVTGVIHDITDRKRAEDALFTSEALFRGLFAQASQLTGVLDLEGKLTRANAAAMALIGLDEDKVVGKFFWETPWWSQDPETKDAMKDAISRARRGESIHFDAVHKDTAGNVHYIDFFLKPVVETNGTIIALLAEGRDITGQRKMAEELKESEEKFRKIIENAPYGMHFYELKPEKKLVFTSANPAADAILGVRHDQFIGKTIEESFPGLSGTEVPERYREAAESGTVWHTEQILYHEGSISGAYAVTAFQTVPGFMAAMFTDITERKRSESALIRANRQLTLLNGITRHDILNKVSTARGYLKIAEMKSGDPTQAEYLEKTDAAITAIKSQIEFTRVFQDLGTHDPQWIELDTVMPRAHVPKTISLSANIQGVMLFSDPMLDKIFFNLLDNSIRHGEHVTEIRVSSHQSAGNLLVIWEDNGTGIAADEKERIFERGFGKNTGLGLFLVREILALTGITIAETGEQGKGARFEILVPEGKFRFQSW